MLTVILMSLDRRYIRKGKIEKPVNKLWLKYLIFANLTKTYDHVKIPLGALEGLFKG